MLFAETRSAFWHTFRKRLSTAFRNANGSLRTAAPRTDVAELSISNDW